MRMKLNKSGQLLLVSAASLAVAGFLSACATLTVDFVYVTSAKAAGSNNYGEVDVFEVNSESGRMRQIPTSPFPSGGRNPVAEAVSSDFSTLYVVNRDDNSIVQFTIGNDGKLYPQNTVNTPGVFPVAVTVNGSNLIVADTYQPLPTCSSTSPCSGSIALYPISSNALQTPAANAAVGGDYWPLALPSSPKNLLAPTAITSNSSNVYVAVNDTTAHAGYVFSFAMNNGSLTQTGFVSAGVQPSGITVDPSGNFVYVTDAASGNVQVFTAANGVLTPLAGSPFQTGGRPSSIVIDRSGKYAYVANAGDSTVTGYTVSNGALSPIATYATDTQPVAIGIDPSLNEYLYTVNFLANTVTGFQVNSTNGTLLNSQFSPYASNANPTAVAAIPHGSQKK